MLNYTEVKIQVTGADQQDLLVATLADAGFEGFEEGTGELQAFIPEGRLAEEDLRSLLQATGLPFSIHTVAQKNWNELWESSFEPVRIGDFCSIRAHFHAPEKGVAHEIVITPKMSFGTGHHATTWLMIDAMQKIPFEDKKVLDFGTGTGVLAILAEKLGAAHIFAIDIDEWSIDNARENIQANGAQHIDLELGDSVGTATRFDIILANINKNVILQHLASLVQHLEPAGTLLLSGLLTTDREEVKQAVVQAGLDFTAGEEKEHWISLCFSNRKD